MRDLPGFASLLSLASSSLCAYAAGPGKATVVAPESGYAPL
jgi:hypothetical protein